VPADSATPLDIFAIMALQLVTARDGGG